ncbi:glycosyltransferase family 4 protein [Rhodobacter ferrooxidans]|uniref:Glycosyl transferase group 1 n=1 Tax=Rhodobacter ferrooxidans TaxID=371731 RepID=C8S4A4_9RHOB|nr:glycosyltransferase family 1 protein [Rhodobacter sp. SW2]EEW24163.1 glycosyl transferase group 1 [Rhodobacter sp. SW2]
MTGAMTGAMTSGQRLRILVNAINDNAQPRGPDRYLIALIGQLVALPTPPEIHLLHAPWQPFFDHCDLGDGGRRSVIAAPRRPAERLIWQATAFARLANALPVGLVFLPNLIWTPGLRRPSVLTAHDLLQFRRPEKFGLAKAALLRPVIRRALARATRVIAVSQFTADDIARFAPVAPDRLSVIHEGGPLVQPRPAQLNKGTDGPLFLFVGKIERTKNVGLLIRAFLASQSLAAMGARLVIVGPDGNASAEIAPLLAQAGDRVQRPGFLPDADLDQLYARCRGFVFPSTAEGFGLVVLEAMARGAPVIAAAATSLPEVVGDAGLLVPPDDAAALQAAMERLAQDADLAARLSDAGYRRLAGFSWQRAAEQTMDVMLAAAREVVH